MSKTEHLRIEGKKGLEDLCNLCEELNGGREKYGQLQLDNGSYVSGLLNFMENNPGVIRAMYDWIEENYEEELKDPDDVQEELDDKLCQNCFAQITLHTEDQLKECKKELEYCNKLIYDNDVLKKDIQMLEAEIKNIDAADFNTSFFYNIFLQALLPK